MTTLTSPHDLLTAVPFLIGYHPESSIVIITIRDSHVGMAMRIDYPEAIDSEQIQILLSHIRRHESDCILLVAYLPDFDHEGLISRSIHSSLSDEGVSIKESIEIRNGRWRSVLCGDNACCPPDGNPLPEFFSSSITAEQVAEGVALPFSNVEAIRASLRTDHPNLSLMTALAEIAPIDYSQSDSRLLQAEGAHAVRDLLNDFALRGMEVEMTRVALVLARLHDLQVRDYALGMATPENQGDLISLWRWLTSIAPAGFAAAPATLYAELTYETGDGAIASRALERALDDQPDYQLAKLLRKTFAAGWEPDQFRQMRSELHPRICQALFASGSEE